MKKLILFFCFSITVLACNPSSDKNASDDQAARDSIAQAHKKDEGKKGPEETDLQEEKDNVAEKPKLQDKPSKAPSAPQGSAMLSAANQSEMLKRINDVRKIGCKCGSKFYPPAAALKWSRELSEIAAAHSVDMATGLGMSHKGSNGSEADQRLSRAGYQWKAYAENVAFGHRTVQEVVAGWVKSVPHCKNIMNNRVSEIGAGEKSKYWTLLFASPQDRSI